MRVTSKGQITIPKAIRERLGICQATELEVELREEGVLFRVARSSSGREAVERLRELGRSSWSGPSTKETMELTRGEE